MSGSLYARPQCPLFNLPHLPKSQESAPARKPSGALARMLGTTDAAETLVAEKTPFVPAEEKRGAVADENYPIRRLSFTAALTPGSQRRVHQDRARKGLLRCLAFAGLVLLLVLGLSRAAME